MGLQGSTRDNPHHVDMKFSQETSPPISILVYGYNAKNNFYNVFNHHDTNVVQIQPSPSYSSSEQLFSNYKDASTNLRMLINLATTNSEYKFNSDNHAFVVVSF